MAFVCFCTYKQCTNYTKCLQILIESYMLLMRYVFSIQNLYILYFSNFCVNMDAIFRSISQLCKISGIFVEDSHINLYYRFI